MNRVNQIVTTSEWAVAKASELKNSFKQDIENHGGVFVRLIEGDNGWDIEIKVNEETIAFTYNTRDRNLEHAINIADEIDEVFEASGLKILPC